MLNAIHVLIIQFSQQPYKVDAVCIPILQMRTTALKSVTLAGDLCSEDSCHSTPHSWQPMLPPTSSSHAPPHTHTYLFLIITLMRTLHSYSCFPLTILSSFRTHRRSRRGTGWGGAEDKEALCQRSLNPQPCLLPPCQTSSLILAFARSPMALGPHTMHLVMSLSPFWRVRHLLNVLCRQGSDWPSFDTQCPSAIGWLQPNIADQVGRPSSWHGSKHYVPNY